MIGPSAMLSRSETLAAAAGGSVLVTANRRLARVLKAEFDAARRAAGDSAWPSPDILPWGAWLLTNWDAAAHRGEGAALPLSPAQERSLWERVVADSEDGETLLQVPAAAALAAEAWALAHEWQAFDALGEVSPNEDGEAFLRWAGRY